MNIAFITHTASHLFCIMVRSMAQCFSLYRETWSPMSLLQFVPLTFTGSYGTCCVYVLGVPFSYVSFNCFFFYCFVFLNCIYRGYYMAAWRYEISLQVLKNISRVSAVNEWNIFFQHEKRNLVSPSGHVMFYLLYKHQWNTKPFHFNRFLVWKARLIM